MFMLMMYLAALMAVIPATASWRQAERVGARVSLGTYVENATLLNLGRAQQDHSVVYGTGADGRTLELDVWPGPADDSRPTRPAFVLVHGGTWTHGNRSNYPDWDRWLNGLGYEVFDVEYRLPPPVRWLDEVGDVKSALGWLSEHAAEYHVDPARIGIMGASAGGNLAMLAAYSAGDARLPPSTRFSTVAVRTVINLYGPSDLAVFYRDSRSPEYIHAACQAYIGGSPEQFPERYALLSPVTHVGASAPPTITLLGTRDRLVSTDQAVQLDEALSKAGVPHETWLLPANDHGFDVNWGGFGTQIARDKIRKFLDRYDPR
jgi:acetyl esterase/lipase